MSGQPSATDMDLIKVLASSYLNSWNKHDPKGFADCFSQDSEFTNVRGVSVFGREEIEIFQRTRFETSFKQSDQAFERTKVRFIKPDVAVVDIWWRLNNVLDDSGAMAHSRRGRLVWVVTKDPPGEWKIRVMHNMEIPVG